MLEKSAENRIRRAAMRQGMNLRRSKLRDKRALGYGTYMLVDLATNEVAFCGPAGEYGLTLDEIEGVLNGDFSENVLDLRARDERKASCKV